MGINTRDKNRQTGYYWVQRQPNTYWVIALYTGHMGNPGWQLPGEGKYFKEEELYAVHEEQIPYINLPYE